MTANEAPEGCRSRDISPYALEMDAVSMSYGSLPVLSEVTIGLVRGGVTAVIGLPGSGKSTLLACATGRRTPTSGWVGRHDRIVTPDPVEWERLPAADRDRPELLVADDLEEAQHLYSAMDLEPVAGTDLVTRSAAAVAAAADVVLFLVDGRLADVMCDAPADGIAARLAQLTDRG
ncbi:ATP-binding cassette domain-containing protein [Streptomyces sp. NPDC052097]|uniref:ATP-binding cassette domain-containing protein n=1 Tax=Streptomyces sp. NPDC052097 TaxID=3154948 RepID=UPI003450E4BA